MTALKSARTLAASLGVLVVGALAALTPRTSLRSVTWAAVATCVLGFGAAVVAGGVAWAVTTSTVLAGPLLASGLVLGALLVRRVRHA